MEFGARSAPAKREQAVSKTDLEVDLGAFGDRRHRLVSRVQGRDVRKLMPSFSLKVRPGAPVFAVLPLGDSWRRTGWRAARVQKVNGSEAVLRTEEGRVWSAVPAAMILRPDKKRLKRGAVVRVHSGRALPFGRVVSTRGRTVLVRTAWLGAIREIRAPRHEVMRVGKGLQPAAPVIYSLDTTARIGSLVVMDRRYRWVLGAEGVIHRRPWTEVSAFGLRRRYVAGDYALAALPVSLKPVVVLRVLGPDGLRYAVRPEGEKREPVVAFHDLAPPQ